MKNNKQVGGSHYKDMKIQPVDFIVANSIPYREANAIKYICRHQSKNKLEDIEKAIHYLEMIRDEYKTDNTPIDTGVKYSFEGDLDLDIPLESVVFRWIEK